MRRSIILPIFVAGAASLVLAACGGSSTSGMSTGAGASTGLVSAATVNGTHVLTGPGGKTLYSATVEKGGKIHCVGACTSFWKPVQASPTQAKQAAAKLGASLGTVKRPDGSQQLTFKGMPLYEFATEGAGKLQGNGFTDDFQGTHFMWQAVGASGGAMKSSSPSSTPSGGGYGY